MCLIHVNLCDPAPDMYNSYSALSVNLASNKETERALSTAGTRLVRWI